MIKEIEFKQTSNIFLNSGIIGLYIYLNKHKKDKTIDYKFDSKLEKDNLKITSDNLFKLLEDVYYKMGKDYYDTSSNKAIKEASKFYFIKKPFKAEPFAKMFSYGLAALITNNPTAIASKNGGKIKFEKLLKDEPDFALKIAKELNKKGKKLKFFSLSANNEIIENPIDKKTKKRKENKGGESEIFLNAGYTKTPNIDFESKYFEEGEFECYLTGENYKKLYNCISTSPLLSGKITNFESFGEIKGRNISWKAMYLSRFSPVLCFYSYLGSEKNKDLKIICYFFNSNNLINLNELYKINHNFLMEKQELLELNFRSNFKIWNFFKQKKDNSSRYTDKNDFVLESENVFVLLYTFYRQFLFNNEIIEPEEKEEFELENIFDKLPVNLIYFRSDQFSKTMRPSIFEYFNQFKFIIHLFVEIDKNKLNLGNILSYLKFIKKSEREASGWYQIERKLRNDICCKVLNTKSIIKDFVLLFYNAFLQMMSGDFERYRNYNNLLKFLNIYENLIKYGGNQSMNEELQEKAVNLGSSIGIGIRDYNNAKDKQKQKENIKGGRKYIISLNKSRTMKQFLDEIIRIMNKYGNIIPKETYNAINEDNWEYIKRFSLISALNLINATLKPFDNKIQNEGVKK